MEVSYNNNDIGTAFVGLGTWGASIICYSIFRKFFTDKQMKDLEVSAITILFMAFLLKNPDSFRWFKTVTITGEIVPTKVFYHDTRKLTTNFYFDKNNNFKIYNSQSGDNTLYVSTADKIFTVCKTIVPYFIPIADEGEKIHISAWKYFFYNGPYEIFTVKPFKN